MAEHTKTSDVIHHCELDDPTTINTPELVDSVSIYSTDELVVMSFRVAMPDQDCRIEVCRLAMTRKLASFIISAITKLQQPLADPPQESSNG